VDATVHMTETSILSKKVDGLPWPLLNPHSLEFLTTHGLHCYYSNEVTVSAPKSAVTPIDKLHAQHCMQELNEVRDFLPTTPQFQVPSILCPTITGQGKEWKHHVGGHMLNYYNSTGVYKLTLDEYLLKDRDFQAVYRNKKGALYVNYSHNGPSVTQEKKDDKLYVNYSHNGGTTNGTSSIVHSLNQQYISAQDTELRMIAGYHYGLVLLKHLIGTPMTEPEKLYMKETKKTEVEVAWVAASFVCTFGDKTSALIQQMDQAVRAL